MRIDPPDNVHRFYRMEIMQGLFGDWSPASDAKSGPKAWRNRVLNKRRSTSVSLTLDLAA